jgi:long-subunit fatty acid transport protein
LPSTRRRLLGRALAATAAAAGLWLPAPAAQASPLDDPHIGGIGFSGPATGDLAAVYWNPAAVGLIADNEALIGGSGRFSALSLRRDPIDPATGAPGGARSFPEAHGTSTLQPVAWPPQPGAFLAVAASLGNRFTLAVAAYSPFSERVHWRPAADGEQPTRFHALDIDLRNWALVPALAIRVGGGLRIGAAPGFLFSVGRLTFDEDTALAGGAAGVAADCGGAPCGVENPAAAARYDLSTGLSPFDSSLSFTMGGGLHLQRPAWAVGLGYITRPLGGGEVEIPARRTRLQAPSRLAGQPPLCPADAAGPCFFGDVRYRLPDTLTGGFTYYLNPRVDLGLVFRWLNLSQHDAIRIRVSGPATGGLRSHGLPEQVVLFRGFQDTYDLRARAMLRVGERILIGAGLRAETSAVPADALSPAAVDGFKLEPSLAAQVRATSWLLLTAGYAFTFVPAVSTGRSLFDPTTEIACEQAGGDLGTEACKKRQVGQARPTAAGRYSLSTHSVSLFVTARL